jgi:hypothetical protein
LDTACLRPPAGGCTASVPCLGWHCLPRALATVAAATGTRLGDRTIKRHAEGAPPPPPQLAWRLQVEKFLAEAEAGEDDNEGDGDDEDQEQERPAKWVGGGGGGALHQPAPYRGSGS